MLVTCKRETQFQFHHFCSLLTCDQSMKTLKHKANRTGSFLHRLFKLLVDHGTIGFLLLFVFGLQFCAAQTGSSSPPGPPSEQLPLGSRFNPSMAIIMVVLVSAFFLMGFFSVYIRRCADSRYRGGRGGGTFDPAALFGGGRLSRRLQMGLDPAVIEGFPTFVYSSVKGLKIGKGSLECAVCLNEFQDDDTLRLIPKCFHAFHPDCIDAWLASHTTCPVCRANLVPRPGDLPFAAVHFFEPDGNSAEPDGRSNVNDEVHGQNQVAIDILHSDDDNKEVAQAQSPDANLMRAYSTSNRAPRSWSNRWSFGRLFPRSHSTGHSLVQPGENCERFTLRLPEEVRSQLVNIQLNRTKSSVPFPRARSSRRGYRSASVGTGRGRSYFNHERFEQGRPSRWGFSATPPFFSRTGSVRPSREAQAGTSDEVNEEAPNKNFLKSVKSPFDRLFLEAVNNNKDVGGRSSDRLRIDDGQA